MPNKKMSNAEKINKGVGAGFIAAGAGKAANLSMKAMKNRAVKKAESVSKLKKDLSGRKLSREVDNRRLKMFDKKEAASHRKQIGRVDSKAQPKVKGIVKTVSTASKAVSKGSVMRKLAAGAFRNMTQGVGKALGAIAPKVNPKGLRKKQVQDKNKS